MKNVIFDVWAYVYDFFDKFVQNILDDCKKNPKNKITLSAWYLRITWVPLLKGI